MSGRLSASGQEKVTCTSSNVGQGEPTMMASTSVVYSGAGRVASNRTGTPGSS